MGTDEVGGVVVGMPLLSVPVVGVAVENPTPMDMLPSGPRLGAVVGVVV